MTETVFRVETRNYGETGRRLRREPNLRATAENSTKPIRRAKGARILIRAFLPFTILALFACHSPAWSAPTARGIPTVELGSSETPPFWSANLPGNGMGGEILHAISRHGGIESIVVFFPTKRLIRMKTGNHLGDPEHWPDQKFVAVIPIATFRSSFYYYRPNHKKGIVFSGLSDLRGYTHRGDQKEHQGFVLLRVERYSHRRELQAGIFVQKTPTGTDRFVWDGGIFQGY